MPRGGDPDVLGEIVADGLLAGLGQAEMLLPVLEPVVNAPHVEGDVLAEMADDNLQVGMAIKDAIGDHSQDMEAHALGKAEGRANQPLPVGPELIIDGAGGVAGVEIQWDVQVGAGLPEHIPLGLVIEDVVIPVWASTLGVVDQGAFEAILLDTATEFGGGLLGAMHRQGPDVG